MSPAQLHRRALVTFSGAASKVAQTMAVMGWAIGQYDTPWLGVRVIPITTLCVDRLV